ncbi:formylglycine-generating enzyme family protein [Kitasatospora sp. NBC_00458]|uniref:formylglycine-generating enzyme family protein n=1 Tax=Kitasatospora sp. NBC_00458 TaxID=2903568 RepID=UPI002E18E535
MDAHGGTALITVPAGEVVLSDRRTLRSWPVRIAPYRLAAVPVTRAEYARVAGAAGGGREADGGLLPAVEVSWWDAVRYCNARSALEGLAPAYRIGGGPAEDCDGGGGGGDGDGGADGRGPAIGWDTAADGYRLPTEAEWEHACRAGTTGPRYGLLDEIAWHRGNSGERAHEVGGRRPNPWGFHDLLGNVWEWCWDQYDPAVYGSYRVLRGGGWFDEHWSCRASVRRRSHPTLRLDDVGFRVARSGPG